VHYHIFLPISFGGVDLIFFEVIITIVYFGTKLFIAHVIGSKFLVDFHLFILEAIRTNNLGLFSFQADLKLTQKIFPTMVALCVPPFE
jgi:hypothetical protein